MSHLTAPLAMFDRRASLWKIALAAIAVALALRLLMLNGKSLWLDEALALRVTHAGQAALWAGQSELAHPPLYYALLGLWTPLGESEVMLRLPSALLGALSVALIYSLAADLINRRAALAAAWLCALSPLLIWYSQEARSYSLLMFLGLAAMLAFVRLLTRPRWYWGLLFVLAMTGALYTHYDALLLVPLQFILATMLLAAHRAQKSALPGWLIGWVVVIAAYSPWLNTLPARRSLAYVTSDNSYIALLFADRFHLNLANLWPVLIGTGGLIGLWLLYRISRSYSHRWTRLCDRAWVRAGVALIFLITLVAFVVPRGYTLKRHVVILWPYALMTAAWFWPWTPSRKQWLTALLTASLIASLVNVLFIPQDQWREATHYVVAESGATDLALLLPSYMTIPFDYYNRGRMVSIGANPSDTPDRLAAWLKDHRRIWLLSHEIDIGDPQDRIAGWLAQHATRIKTVSFYHIQVQLFEAK